jgi:hypothetical protein
MDVLEYTQQRTDHLLDRVHALQAGDFAQGDSEAALTDIEHLFEGHKEQLLKLASTKSDPAIAANHCQLVLGALFQYLPLLGFLHRSKSASNAFELYGPLHGLATRIIGQDARLILSSEWDFSPYTYVRMPDFPQYVLLGLPASESRNALLVPLAGHEFGHSVWARTNLADKLRARIRDAVIVSIRTRIGEWKRHFSELADENKLATDLFYVQAWTPAYLWALKQCEEAFCDILGLLIFDAAYLHAFAYLLAPGVPGRRIPNYPTIRQRAEYLLILANQVRVAAPVGYADLFTQPPIAGGSPEDFLVSVSDDVLRALMPQLLDLAKLHLSSVGHHELRPEEIDVSVGQLELLAPVGAPSSLSVIVNAAWRVAGNPDVWKDFRRIHERRHDVLNELVVKSAQVLEYNERTKRKP